MLRPRGEFRTGERQRALLYSEWITNSDWGFPIMLVFHSRGMAASRLIVNWSFLSKMTCVLPGGIVTAVLWCRPRAAGALSVAIEGGGRVVAVNGEDSLAAAPLAVDRSVRILAIVSLAMWSGAIVFGPHAVRRRRQKQAAVNWS